MRTRRSIVTLFLTLTCCFGPVFTPGSAAARPSAAPALPLKIATIFPGVITDADYNTLGSLALTALKNDLGIQTVHSESVAVPDFERVAREYIDDGVNVVWAHGGQFLTQAVELARQTPEVSFIVETDSPVDDPPANLWVLDRNYFLGYYPLGAIAAAATRTGKIAYVGGLTLPWSYAEVRAARQALADTGARADLKAVWVGDFNDPAKARQIADALVADNVDVIMSSLNLGMFGIFEAVKSAPRPVLVTAKHSDKASFVPKHYVTSVLYDFVGPLKEVARRLQRGEKGGLFSFGLGRGIAIQLPLTNVPPELSARIEQMVERIRQGKISVKKDSTALR